MALQKEPKIRLIPGFTSTEKLLENLAARLDPYVSGSGKGGGGIAMHFPDEPTRDDYFVEHPDELKENVTVGVGNPIVAWTWVGGTWIAGAFAFIGPTGTSGQDGTDGVTPEIGANKNWWIGGVDTGILAEGTNGQDGQDGIDGNTPSITIGGNGNWFINGIDTNQPSRGATGTPGIPGSDGIDGIGIPVGGTTGQVLSKRSGGDFDTIWVTSEASGGGGSGTPGADGYNGWSPVFSIVTDGERRVLGFRVAFNSD